MRKSAPIIVIVLLFAAVPLFAARKPAAKSAPAPKPICNVMTRAEFDHAMLPCPKGDDAATCTMAHLWARAIYATNANAGGDCKARELLDDDLFAPMMAGALMAGGPHLTDEAAQVYAHYIPQFRRHVADLAKAGTISRKDADEMDSMAARLAR
jgi:hypothetical protein